MARVAPPKADYYAILNIPKTASEDDIRLAYKSKALALHPDKNPDPNSTAQFQKLTEAYTALKDPKSRQQYDRFGTVHVEEDYEDYSDDEYDCSCGQRHRHRPTSFEDFFTKMFNRHYDQYGARGFYDEDLYESRDSRNFWGSFRGGTYGRSADWSAARGPHVSAADLKRATTPDQPPRPKVTVAPSKRAFIVEWTKKEPRKQVDKWHVSYALSSSTNPTTANSLQWTELSFPAGGKSGEIPISAFSQSHAFRTAASNSSGKSDWSEIVTAVAPTAPPPDPKSSTATANGTKKKESSAAPPTQGAAAKGSTHTAPMRRPAVEEKLKQLTAELDAAARSHENSRITKAIHAAREELLRQPPPQPNVSDPTLDRLLAAVEIAEDLIKNHQRAGERKKLLEQLRAAAKKGNNETFTQVETRLSALVPPNADEAAQLAADIKSAKDELKQVRRDGAAKATTDLRNAMSGSDIEKLREAITRAAEYSLPLKDAKKQLRDMELEEEQRKREEDEAAAAAAAAEEEGAQQEEEEEVPAEEVAEEVEEVPAEEEGAAPEEEEADDQAEEVSEEVYEPTAEVPAPTAEADEDEPVPHSATHHNGAAVPPAEAEANMMHWLPTAGYGAVHYSWDSAEDEAEAAAYAHAHAAFGLGEESLFSFPPHVVAPLSASSSAAKVAPTSAAPAVLATAFATPSFLAPSSSAPAQPEDGGDQWLMSWFQNRYGDQAAAFVEPKATPISATTTLPPSAKVISKPSAATVTPVSPAPKTAATPVATPISSKPPPPTAQKAAPKASANKKAAAATAAPAPEQKKPEAKTAAKPVSKAAAAVQPTMVDDDEALRQALELSRLEYEQEEKERREAEKKAKRALKIAQKKSAALAAATPAPAAPSATAKPAPVAPSAAADTDSGSRGQAQPSRSLWVGNLSLSVTEEMLRREFSAFGPIESIKLLSAKNPTCAFIDFYDQQHATNAKSGLFGKIMQGREMHIYYSMRQPAPTSARKA